MNDLFNLHFAFLRILVKLLAGWILHLLLQPLQHGRQQGFAVLLVGLHLLLELLLGHLDEVVILLKRFLDDLTFVLALLC